MPNSAATPPDDDFAARLAAVGSGDEYAVFMKNYIATHFGHLLGSKVLLLNTRDGLERLSLLVRQKLAERQARAETDVEPVAKAA
ncbi:MAG: hypothetical protein ACREJ2_02540 [Planctomycetota bacterium]